MADWPAYDTDRRATRVIGSMRDETIDDPDQVRRQVWAGLYAP